MLLKYFVRHDLDVKAPRTSSIEGWVDAWRNRKRNPLLDTCWDTWLINAFVGTEKRAMQIENAVKNSQHTLQVSMWKHVFRKEQSPSDSRKITSRVT